MIEIRLHGRGGQGAVTSAELMATAAIKLGKFAQAFPNFGAERRGAPLMAFLRIDDEPIEIRNIVYRPDMVVVLDHSILRLVNVTEGLKEDGILIANTRFSGSDIRAELNIRHAIATVNANRIAKEVIGLPITNTTMLGAMLKTGRLIHPDSLLDPLKERFGRIADKNINAMLRAYDETIITSVAATEGVS